MTPNLTILAGGESRRMGQDKASLTLDGVTPLLERTARTALAVVDDPARVQIIGRPPADDWPLPGIAFFPDETPGLGPLGGLVTALHHADTVLLLACDMPALTREALAYLLDCWAELPAGATPPPGLATTRDGEVEPLFSVYTAACLPDAEARLRSGRRSLRGLILDLGFPQIAIPGHLSGALANLNTPEDLARYRDASTGSEKP